jgi:hypothetical protein
MSTNFCRTFEVMEAQAKRRRHLLERAQELFGSLVVDVEGFARIEDNYIDISVDHASSDGIVLQFENGKRVRFKTSEWAWIEPA